MLEVDENRDGKARPPGHIDLCLFTATRSPGTSSSAPHSACAAHRASRQTRLIAHAVWWPNSTSASVTTRYELLLDLFIWGSVSVCFDVLAFAWSFAECRLQALSYLAQYHFWPPPVIMITFTLLQIAVHLHMHHTAPVTHMIVEVFIYYDQKTCVNALECPESWTSLFAFRPACKVSIASVHSYQHISHHDSATSLALFHIRVHSRWLATHHLQHDHSGMMLLLMSVAIL